MEEFYLYLKKIDTEGEERNSLYVGVGLDGKLHVFIETEEGKPLFQMKVSGEQEFTKKLLKSVKKALQTMEETWRHE